MKLKPYEFWGIIILVCVGLILLALEIIFLYGNYTISFKMDNNTLEAIKSINWSAIPR